MKYSLALLNGQYFPDAQDKQPKLIYFASWFIEVHKIKAVFSSPVVETLQFTDKKLEALESLGAC